MRPNTLLFATFAMLACVVILAEAAWSGIVLNDTLATIPFSHHIWQEVLSENVTTKGEIRFDALRARPKRLNQYLRQLETLSPESHPQAFETPRDQLAYWINAHNAVALRLILDAYPVERVDHLPNLYDNPRYLLGGKPHTLRQIQTLVRDRFPQWPETFLALTDYGLSSPPLFNQAYEGKLLREQLRTQARAFIQNPHQVSVDSSEECGPLVLGAHFHNYLPSRRHLATRPDESADVALLNYIRRFASPEVLGLLYEACERAILYLPSDGRLRRVP